MTDTLTETTIMSSSTTTTGDTRQSRGVALTLRPYQEDAIRSIHSYFADKKGNPLIVLPTGSGKSIVAAEFVRGVLRDWPDQRILIVTHVQELIAQNYDELICLWPAAPAGIYSAGLHRRDVDARILFAGIQSIHGRAEEVGHVDLVLIDEAHLVPRNNDTTYRRFIDGLKEINQKLKIIGLSATPYRTGSGMLHEGEDRIFTDIAYEARIGDLIEAGYLAPLVVKETDTTLDVSGVNTSGGDFVARDLEAAVDRDGINGSVVAEIIELGRDRKSWLIFCAGVEHARHIAGAFAERGVDCRTIFGNTPTSERDAIIDAFKRGEIRALASMGVLTTGFNAPAVDLIALLRPTKSPGLYVQMAGRGTRLSPGKQNCLLLDFAGNVRRHGPIDLIQPRKLGDSDAGSDSTRTCPSCKSIIQRTKSHCPDCGFEFPVLERAITLDLNASTLPVLSFGGQFFAAAQPQVQWKPVTSVRYARHEKAEGLPSMMVVYDTGDGPSVREWICFEHTGYARKKAEAWWSRHSPGTQIPGSVALALADSGGLRRPTEIEVRPDGAFFKVVSYRFPETEMESGE